MGIRILVVKKFEFRLKRLLWFHQQKKKQAEVLLQQAVMQREAAVAEVDSIQKEIERACQLPEKTGALVNLAARQSIADHLQSLGRTLTAAREKLQKTEVRLREANQVCMQIEKDVEGLLHLRAQQFEEYQDGIAHQQQIALDEVVMRQWSMRDADATA
jgi:flagellar export protein FliJ